MSVTVQAKICETVNYAAILTKEQCVTGDIHLGNLDTDRIVCRITAVPEFIYEYKTEISVSGAEEVISAPELKVNESFCRHELIEAQEGEIRIEVFHPDAPNKVLGFQNASVHIQPYLHWDAAGYPDTLASFLQPNDPLVMQILKRAGEFAASDGTTMHGYQGNRREDVKKQAEYIYRALQEADIQYISTPASFEIYGQKVRIPHQVLHEEIRQGTCLDLAVLYATCLESASLNAAVVIIPGHAFAAVWLENQSFNAAYVDSERVEPDVWQATMKDFLPVECTTFTAGKDVGFAYALASAAKSMQQCRYLVDIAGARNQGLVPVYTYVDKPICDGPESTYEDFLNEEFSARKRTRLDRLRDQAMDITVRSRLLNCAGDPSFLEIALDTESFMLHGTGDEDDWMSKFDTGTSKKKKKTEDMLRELYSRSAQARRETGKSNLFLAVNELRWQDSNSGKHYSAPLYLCPAEIYRNVRRDCRLRVSQEEMFFNPALKVFLSQGCQLDTGRLLDQPGETYGKQMELLRFLIEHQGSWSVRENVARVGLFRIPNEAVWNGLHEQALLDHEIVSGILKGNMDWDNEVEDPLEGTDAKDPLHIYPFETDSSQNEIIQAAFSKKAQVVVGPAGNGKTQTVVNIMLEAVRRGQKVLFVSEKAPAMEVAHDKLNRIFSGVFNLKIIQGKDRPQDVVRQLKKTLDYLEMPRTFRADGQVGSARKKCMDCLAYLEQYYGLMRHKNACGKSLEELIELYEKYADCPVNLTLDDTCGNILLEQAEDKISILSKVLEECDRAKGEYASYIRYDNLQGREEKKTLHLAQDTLEKYERVCEEAMKFKAALSLPEAENGMKMLQLLVCAAYILEACPVYYKEVESILTEDTHENEAVGEELIMELRKLARMVPGTLRYDRRKKKLSEKLRKIYSAQERQELFEDLREDPEEVFRRIQNIHLICDEDGYIIAGNNREKTADLRLYLEQVEQSLAEAPKEVRNQIIQTVRTTIAGEGRDIQEEAGKLIALYLEYDEANRATAEKIVRNADAFARDCPDLPKTVLYKEWIENRNIDTNRSRSLYDKIVLQMEEEGFSGLIRQIEEIRQSSPVTRQEIMGGYYKAWASFQIEKIEKELLAVPDFNYVIFQDKVEQLNQKEQTIRQYLRKEIVQIQLSHMPDIQAGVSNNPEFGVLQALVRKRGIAVRTFFEKVPNILQTVCPCMIMDPAAAAEYIPYDFPPFDLVIIDEGSQMPAYNALIPISRAKRCMIFGDEKQLQPMDQFKKRVEDEYEMLTGRESILTAAYTTSMPRKMLRFHYRSENESLIAFSNIRYYNGDLITFPSCETGQKSVTYEYVEGGSYDRKGSKANDKEALAVIEKIKEIYTELPDDTRMTLGVITLNIHQRDRIQQLILGELRGDTELGMKVDELVSVVNLESCQGKEWDYVVISPGFGYDENGKFLMGFGALNREYGANRLNVMLTRARRHMHVITSIEPYMLKNARAAGTKDFHDFLLYAQGKLAFDTRVCDSKGREEGLLNCVAQALEKEGYTVHTNIGSSECKVDMGIVSDKDPEQYALGILTDHFREGGGTIHDREVIYPNSLQHKGWKIYQLRTWNWYNDPIREIRQIKRALEGSCNEQ